MEFALPDVTENLALCESDAGALSRLANRTCLTALNATIAATRAGASGRGFLAAAHDVQALTSDTAIALDQIGARIGEARDAFGPWLPEGASRRFEDAPAFRHADIGRDAVPEDAAPAGAEFADLDAWIDIFFTRARQA